MTFEASSLSATVTIYVVHYSKLKERKFNLGKNLSDFSDILCWVTEKDIDFSPSKFNQSLHAYGVNFRLSSMDRSNNSRSIIKSRRVARVEGVLLLAASLFLPRGISYLTDNPSPRKQNQSILELSLMHVECLAQANYHNQEWTIILEDDAVVDIDKLNHLLRNLNSLNTNSPVWYNISSGAGLTRTKSDPQPDGLGFFLVRPFGTRCSSGYLVNKVFISQAIKLIETYGIPDWTAIDVIYQIIQRKLRAKVFWQEPSIVAQGSEIGLYKSNLNH